MTLPETTADEASKASSVNVVVVTMDTHLAGAVERARIQLSRNVDNLSLRLHAASEYSTSERKLAQVRADIASADIIVVTMLFMEDHFLPILADLEARRDNSDALICAMSAPEVVKLT